MTVHFIGAGPGAADLITVRGRDACRDAARSASMPARSFRTRSLAWCPPGARSSTPLPRPRRHRCGILAGPRAGRGCRPPSFRRPLDLERPRRAVRAGSMRLRIPYTLTPGVPAFAAAAAALGRELTLPEVAQSVVLTRTSGRASAMPENESLAASRRPGRRWRSISRSTSSSGSWGSCCRLRRGLPGGRRLARLLAGRARAHRGRLRRSPPLVRAEGWSAPRSSWSARPSRDRFRQSALYSAGYDRRFRPRRGGRSVSESHEGRVRAPGRPSPPSAPSTPCSATVWLVGAGPGDPGLLTLHRRQCARGGRCRRL